MEAKNGKFKYLGHEYNLMNWIKRQQQKSQKKLQLACRLMQSRYNGIIFSFFFGCLFVPNIDDHNGYIDFVNDILQSYNHTYNSLVEPDGLPYESVFYTEEKKEAARTHDK